MKPRLITTALLMLPPGIGQASADLLWDNGEWDRAKAISAERNTEVSESWLVDDLLLTDAVEVQSVQWLAMHSTGFDPTSVDVILLSSDLESIIELSDLEYQSHPEGEFMGLEVERITINDFVINLDPGRYFIGVRFVGDGTGRAHAALQRPIHGVSESYFRSEYFGLPDWVPVSELGLGPLDAVFKVYGDIIPAPATLALALPCLLAFRRRR